MLHVHAEQVPGVPVNIMDQYHPDNFCDPGGAKYRPQYAEIARRADRAELRDAYRRARELGLRFEAVSFEKRGFGNAVRALGL